MCVSVLVQAMNTIKGGGAVYGEDGTGKASLLAYAAVQVAQQEKYARSTAERCHLHCCATTTRTSTDNAACTTGVIANPAAN